MGGLRCSSFSCVLVQFLLNSLCQAIYLNTSYTSYTTNGSLPITAPPIYTVYPDGLAWQNPYKWHFPSYNTTYRKLPACTVEMESLLALSGSLTVGIFGSSWGIVRSDAGSAMPITARSTSTETRSAIDGCCVHYNTTQVDSSVSTQAVISSMLSQKAVDSSKIASEAGSLVSVLNGLNSKEALKSKSAIASTANTLISGQLTASTLVDTLGANSVHPASITSSHTIVPRIHSMFNASLSYVVGSDGFTYRYPSIYAIFETMYASYWFCDEFAHTHKHVTLSYRPDELFSIDFGHYVSVTKSFDIGDLACSLSSGKMQTDLTRFSNGSYGLTTSWSQQLPWIAPPYNLQDVDPAFRTCTARWFQGYDPPRAITSVMTMAQASDPATASLSASPQAAVPSVGATKTSVFEPVSQLTSSLPPFQQPSAQAGAHSLADPGFLASSLHPSPTIQPPSLVSPIPADKSIDLSSNESQQPSPTTQDPPLPASSVASLSHTFEESQTSNNRPSTASAPNPPSNSVGVIIATSQQIHSLSTVRGLVNVSPITIDPIQTSSVIRSLKTEVRSASTSHGLANAVLSAFGFQPAQINQGASIIRTGEALSPTLALTTSMMPSSHPTATISSVESEPSFIVLGGSLVAAGGSAVNILGESVPMDHSGNLAVGSTTPIALGSVANHESNTPDSELRPMLAIGSHSFTLSIPAPTDVVPPAATVGIVSVPIASSGLEISGTPVGTAFPVPVSHGSIKAGPSKLIIGSSTIAVPALPSIYGTNAQAPTTIPSVLYIDGTSISAYQSGASLGGIPVSLGSSDLVIGSRTIPLSQPSVFAVSDQMVTIGRTLSSPRATGGFGVLPVYTVNGYTFTERPQLGSLSTPLPSVHGLGAILLSAFKPGVASQTIGSSTTTVSEPEQSPVAGTVSEDLTTLSPNITVGANLSSPPSGSNSESRATRTGRGTHPEAPWSIAVILCLGCILIDICDF